MQRFPLRQGCLHLLTRTFEGVVCLGEEEDLTTGRGVYILGS